MDLSISTPATELLVELYEYGALKTAYDANPIQTNNKA
jgi:hypothetical protein